MSSEKRDSRRWNAIALGAIFGVAAGVATANPFIGVGVGVAMFAAFYGRRP